MGVIRVLKMERRKDFKNQMTKTFTLLLPMFLPHLIPHTLPCEQAHCPTILETYKLSYLGSGYFGYLRDEWFAEQM